MGGGPTAITVASVISLAMVAFTCRMISLSVPRSSQFFNCTKKVAEFGETELLKIL
jgi:hypothetical protein